MPKAADAEKMRVAIKRPTFQEVAPQGLQNSSSSQTGALIQNFGLSNRSLDLDGPTLRDSNIDIKEITSQKLKE